MVFFRQNLHKSHTICLQSGKMPYFMVSSPYCMTIYNKNVSKVNFHSWWQIKQLIPSSVFSLLLKVENFIYVNSKPQVLTLTFVTDVFPKRHQIVLTDVFFPIKMLLFSIIKIALRKSIFSHSCRVYGVYYNVRKGQIPLPFF